MRRLRIVQIGMGHDHAYVISEARKMSDMFDIIGVAIPDSDEAYLKKLKAKGKKQVAEAENYSDRTMF